jgi:hypothetical protein
MLLIALLLAVSAAALLTRGQRIATKRISNPEMNTPYCRLGLASKSLNDIKVKISVVNPTNEPIGVNPDYLPQWNRVRTSIFHVDRNGVSIPYRLPYDDWRSGEMLQIEPNTQASVSIALSRAGYDVTGEGTFTISYPCVAWVGGWGDERSSIPLVVRK